VLPVKGSCALKEEKNRINERFRGSFPGKMILRENERLFLRIIYVYNFTYVLWCWSLTPGPHGSKHLLSH
jgi:hypothetical protein